MSWHERRRPVHEDVVLFETVFVGHFNRIAEALGDEQSGVCALAFDNRVGCERRAVNDQRQIAVTQARLAKHQSRSLEHGLFRRRGVVSILRLYWAPSTSNTKSVNVPPISIASRAEFMKQPSSAVRFLDVAPEVGFANTRILANDRGGAFHEFAPEFHDNCRVGYEERTVHILLNDEHGDSLACDIAHRSENVGLHLWRQAK